MAKVKTIWMEGKRGLKPMFKVANGFVLGNTQDNKLVMEMIGEPDFEETIETLFNFMLHTMAIANDITNGEKKDAIYDHVVSTFSLFVDKFHPEMKERKFENQSDEEVLKKKEKEILNAPDKQGKTKVS